MRIQLLETKPFQSISRMPEHIDDEQTFLCEICRCLPSLFGRRRLSAPGCSGLHRPRGRKLIDRVWHWEQTRLARGRSIPCGASCLAIAAKTSDGRSERGLSETID